MGGVLILFAVLVPFFVFSDMSVASFAVLMVMIGGALIGFADDWIKIVKQALAGPGGALQAALQLLLGLLIGFVALRFTGLDTTIDVPFSSTTAGSLSTFWWYVLIVVVIWSATNAVNLTDGLDGLAAGTSAIVLLAWRRSRSSSGAASTIRACST